MDYTEDKVLKKIQSALLITFHELRRVCDKYQIQYYLAYGSLLGAVRHKGFIPWDNDMDVWMTRDNYMKLCQHKEAFGNDFELIQPDAIGHDKFLCPTPRLSYKLIQVKGFDDLFEFYGEKAIRLHIDIFLIDRTYSNIRGKLQRYELCFLYGLMGAYRCKSYDPGAWTPMIRFAQKILNPIGRLISLRWLWKRVNKVAERFDSNSDTNLYFESANTFAAIMRNCPRSAFDETVLMKFEDTYAHVPQGYDTVLRIQYGDYMKLPPVEERVPHAGLWSNLKETEISSDSYIFVDEESNG